MEIVEVFALSVVLRLDLLFGFENTQCVMVKHDSNNIIFGNTDGCLATVAIGLHGSNINGFG